MSPRRGVLLLLVLGLVVRLLPAPFTGHSWDMYVWFRSGEMFLSGNINVYAVSELEGFPWGFYSYPPTWLYWLATARAISNVLSLPTGGLVLLIKLPIIAADLAIGLLLYLLTRRLGLGEGKGLLTLAAYLFNPVVIFISSVWGMFDALAAVFAVISLHLLAKHRYCLAAFSLGLGTAIKLFPAILMPVVILYMRSNGELNTFTFKRLLASFLTPQLLISIPYAPYMQDYLAKLLFHSTSIGQFNLWTIISALAGAKITPIFSWVLFVAFIYLVLKGLGGFRKYAYLPTAFSAILVVFMATSPKVNVQYLVWVYPFLLLDSVNRWRLRSNNTLSLLLINIAATTFIASTIPIMSYTIDNLGKINIISYKENVVVGTALVTSAVIAGWRFVTLMFHYAGLDGLYRYISERWGVVALLMTFSLSIGLFPGPAGIQLDDSYPRIAVIDGVDSFFSPSDGDSFAERMDNMASPTHIVLPLAPDFYNTYTGYSPYKALNGYLRFKLDVSDWKQKDLLDLISQLKKSGFRVLAGMYTAPIQKYVSYGMHGYVSKWILNDHRYLLDGGEIMFDAELRPDGSYVNAPIRYSDYLAGKIEAVLRDFGLDGIYILTEPKGIDSTYKVLRVLPLLKSLRYKLGDRYLIIIDGVDPFLDTSKITKIAEEVDYVVLHTSPWLDGIRYPWKVNRTLEGYKLAINRLLRSSSELDVWKLLYSVYIMDMTAGWALPAIQIQLEADAFASLMRSGYAMYYVSRYTPYKFRA